MTLHELQVVMAAVGLAKPPVVELSSELLAAKILRRAIRDNEPTEQERAEFGCPSPWLQRVCEE